jgi:crotonobetainyl-CoA:carnitine CoA-transferase CaiB-like acyl-CoA transferase
MGYPRMLTPHRRPYATKDGHIAVIAVSDAHWSRLFEAMGRARLIDDPRFASIAARSDNVDALYAVLTEGMRERTTAEWLAILGSLDIPCGPANTLLDLLDDEYLKETEFFQRSGHPLDGNVTITAIPARFSVSPPSVRRLWPALGEHTEEVLREIGCSDQEMRAILQRQG